jgi:membrane-bound metal-dependent hydrolase YbcI (DUF457 family)
MPFTPFHMGPGITVKAVAGRRFSLMVFGFSQVAIDIEPLVRILRGDTVLHGFTHTLVGATLIGLVSAVVGRPICQLLLNAWPEHSDSAFLDWLRGPKLISWPAAFAGAFVGTYSHILLDGIMHFDMRPFAPASDANPMLHLISTRDLHLACLLSGSVGALAILMRYCLQQPGRRRDEDVNR